MTLGQLQAWLVARGLAVSVHRPRRAGRQWIVRLSSRASPHVACCRSDASLAEAVRKATSSWDDMLASVPS